MPKQAQHILLWSPERQCYEFFSAGTLQRAFAVREEQTWLEWLNAQNSFAFRGQRGRLSVVREARARGDGYWYAYGSPRNKPRKRYLGPTPQVTLARLEAEAGIQGRFAASERIEEEVEKPFVTSGKPLLTATPLLVAPVLTSKLSLPRLPAALVERLPLQTRLEEALACPLTLVAASGGWGKTTLLSAWALRSSRPVAWLSLDEMDNMPVRFWGAVIAALRTCHAGIGATALALLYAPQPAPLALILTSLLNDLAALEGTMVLLLDDYHLITDEAIHQSLLSLLEHLPTTLRVVLASRGNPPFPLARLRMRGQLSEIRDPDLRFGQEDARHFLVQCMGLPLVETEIEILERRTEGWIAGLQLAALAMRQREDRAAFVRDFGGSHRYVLDYFQDDVLARLPAATQDFLLQTSILTRLHAPLCQAVTGEAHSLEILEELERSHLFLVPLDEERRWYRFHELFRQTLLARLSTCYPDRVSRLHLRAARWYEAQGASREALAHALAAADFTYAAYQMERAAEEAWAMGGARTVRSWVELLPDEVLRAHVPFALLAALHLLHILFGVPDEQQRAAVGHIVDRIERLVNEADLEEQEQERLQRRLRLFHLWSAASQAIIARDMPQLQRCRQEMLPLARTDEIIWQLAPLFVNFIFYMNALNSSTELQDALQIAARQAEENQQRYEWLRIRQWFAQVLWEAGETRQAEQNCRMLLGLLEREKNYQSSIDGYISLTLARVYWASGREDEAREYFARAFHLAQNWHYMALLAECCECRALFALDTGELAEAEQNVDALRNLTQTGGIAIRLPQVESVQIRLWLAQGNLAAAQDWVERTRFEDALLDALAWEKTLALARLRLAQHVPGEALVLLERLERSAAQGQRRERVAQALALQVVALAALKERQRAREVVIHLLQVTQPGELVRVYLNAGEAMRCLLEDVQTTFSGEHTLAPELKRHLDLVLAAFSSDAPGASPSIPARLLTISTPSKLREPLSAQEQRVLHLLVAGHTYAEMARELIVSPNTIKTQVSSIYRKLGVSRRAEASLLAQRLSLLENSSSLL